MQNAINRAILVAKAGCVRVGQHVGVGAVTTALALMLSIGGVGCSSSHSTTGLDADGDGYTSEVDCDDSRDDVYPGAPPPPEDCSAVGPALDYDCDGIPEPVLVCNPIPEDLDGDGYFSYEDCNDGDPTIYPGAPEDPCDVGGPDRDCDGIPPGLACNPFPDLDGDGYPAPEDCDDNDALTYPGAPEDACEGIDRNCDGEITPIICNPFPEDDFDGDGYLNTVDCDDSDGNIYPGADEPDCPDGADQNCDGIDGSAAAIACPPADADGDGYPSYYDCDDTEDWIHPGADEGACPDGTDQDCDGLDGDPDLICNGMADPVEPPDSMSV